MSFNLSSLFIQYAICWLVHVFYFFLHFLLLLLLLPIFFSHLFIYLFFIFFPSHSLFSIVSSLITCKYHIFIIRLCVVCEWAGEGRKKFFQVLPWQHQDRQGERERVDRENVFFLVTNLIMSNVDVQKNYRHVKHLKNNTHINEWMNGTEKNQRMKIIILISFSYSW